MTNGSEKVGLAFRTRISDEIQKIGYSSEFGMSQKLENVLVRKQDETCEKMLTRKLFMIVLKFCKKL